MIDYKIIIFFLFLLLIILIVYIFGKIKISNLNYNNYILRNFLEKDTINSMKKCFTLNDKKSIDCYRNKQDKIFKKLKKQFNTNYISIGHARWSGNDGTKNYDAQSYHRDIKPNFLKHKGNYPNVYTLVCFLDKSIHIQGNKKYIFEPGDCLLFNSFNLHKAVNINTKSNRRVVQFFHIFFNEIEKKNFYKNHSYAEHYHSDFFLKKINSYVDTRVFVELFNLVVTLLPMKLYNSNKNTYVTLINKSEKIANINGIKYYKKF